MGRPALYTKGDICPRGHLLNAKNLRRRQRGSGVQSGSYCLRCHAEWHMSRYLQKKQYLSCSMNGG